MSTMAPEAVRNLALAWSHLFDSAKISGIVGDERHAAQGGYHISREDQPATNYSVVRPDDKGGPDDAAAAIDMTMNEADMKACTARLIKLFDNTSDPRRKYLNAFNGWLGTGDAQRWDIYARTKKKATPDHRWHVHLEIRRKYVTSATAMKAILSALKGETVATYLKSIGVSVPAASQSSSAVKAPPYPGILRRNDGQTTPNASVKAFQSRMRERGWTSVGTPDGFFGPKLEAVVKRWQTTIGVTADGVIGPKTWPTPWTRPIAK